MIEKGVEKVKFSFVNLLHKTMYATQGKIKAK